MGSVFAGLATALACVPVWACSVCGGDPASPLTAGMNMAIVALLVITGGVLSACSAFFLYLRRRARAARESTVDTAWADGLRGLR